MKGRPTKMEDLVVQKLVDAFNEGATDSEACASVGICKNTLYNFIEDNPGHLLNQKETLKTNISYKAKRRRNELMNSSDEKVSMQACKDILDRHEGKAKERIEHSGRINATVAIQETLSKLSKLGE